MFYVTSAFQIYALDFANYNFYYKNAVDKKANILIIR